MILPKLEIVVLGACLGYVIFPAVIKAKTMFGKVLILIFWFDFFSFFGRTIAEKASTGTTVLYFGLVIMGMIISFRIYKDEYNEFINRIKKNF